MSADVAIPLAVQVRIAKHKDDEPPLHRSTCMFEWQSLTKYLCPGICTVTAKQQGQHLLHYCLFGMQIPMAS